MNKISSLVPSQFPLFYQIQGSPFILFLQSYYEWAESEGNFLDTSRKLLDYSQIDKTLDQFLNHFFNEYLYNIPQNLAVDPRLLVKHVLDLYRSKGTPRAYELLFRILFNEDIQLFIPNEYLFSSSNAQWVQFSYLTVLDDLNLVNLIGQKVENSSQTASAIVQDYYTTIDNGIRTGVIVLNDVSGTFSPGEFIIGYPNDTILTTGQFSGSWLFNKSATSSNDVLQDSYFWQLYSYEIIAERALETYKQTVENLVHPVGMIMFGKFAINDTFSLYDQFGGGGSSGVNSNNFYYFIDEDGSDLFISEDGDNFVTESYTTEYSGNGVFSVGSQNQFILQ